MRIYLSGPINSVDDIRRIRNIKDNLSENGKYTVYDPSSARVFKSKTIRKEISESDAIIMLNGWKKDKRSIKELECALLHGVKVFMEGHMYLEEKQNEITEPERDWEYYDKHNISLQYILSVWNELQDIKEAMIDETLTEKFTGDMLEIIMDRVVNVCGGGWTAWDDEERLRDKLRKADVNDVIDLQEDIAFAFMTYARQKGLRIDQLSKEG